MKNLVVYLKGGRVLDVAGDEGINLILVDQDIQGTELKVLKKTPFGEKGIIHKLALRRFVKNELKKLNSPAQ